MNILSALRDNVQWGRQVVEMTIEGVTNDVAHWVPPGTAHPIGALYTHVLVAEDMIVNAMLKGGAPLLGSTFAGKTGTSDPQFMLTPEWSRALKVDMPALREYAKAVYAATDAYVDSLTEADLENTRDLSQFGMGVRTVGWMLMALVAGHANNLAGEISVTKGLQGLKGYPF